MGATIALIIAIALGHAVIEPHPVYAVPGVAHRDIKPHKPAVDDDRDCAEILDEDDGEDCED